MWRKRMGGDLCPCNVPMPCYIRELGAAGIAPNCAVLIAVSLRPISMVVFPPHLMLYHVCSGKCGLRVLHGIRSYWSFGSGSHHTASHGVNKIRNQPSIHASLMASHTTMFDAGEEGEGGGGRGVSTHDLPIGQPAVSR